MIRKLCPSCGATISVSGAALIVFGLLWLLLWGMILSDDAELIGVVGGVVLWQLASCVLFCSIGLDEARNANQTVQRTGASRSAQRQIECHRRLAPVADLVVGRRQLLIVECVNDH